LDYKEEIELNKFDNIRVVTNPLIRWIFIIAGFIFVIIGIIGMFLPLLPTTVFLLLAAACFARSSEKFYIWLHTNKYFGKYISSYRAGNGMTVRSKIMAISVLWITILISVYFSMDKLYIVILLLAILAGVTIHLIKIPTTKINEQE
jgi:uncharacterized membrane protein YbaN (DUF454 family)